MDAIVQGIIFLTFVAIVGGMLYFVLRLVKQAPPRPEAPVPLGFHERKAMDLREFYETYYLKPGSEIRMSEVQAGLTLFAMVARVPVELLRPTDRLSDFGARSQNLFSSLLTIQLQRNPKLADGKPETVDDMIQLALKGEAEQPAAGNG